MSISSTAINVWRLMGVVEAVEVTSSMWREREWNRGKKVWKRLSRYTIRIRSYV